MKGIVLVTNQAEQMVITVKELCDACQLLEADLYSLIEFDIIHPLYQKEQELYFSTADIQRVKMALRLQRDLELNLAGVAIILDLLDELKDMQARVALLEKYYR